MPVSFLIPTRPIIISHTFYTENFFLSNIFIFFLNNVNIYNRLLFIHEKINLFKVQDDTLGSVKFITRGNTLLKSIQLTMTSIAPVILGIISEYLLITKVVSNINSIVLLWIIYYVIISILLHMTMSTQDIKNALKGLPVCTVIIYIILSITKFSII